MGSSIMPKLAGWVLEALGVALLPGIAFGFLMSLSSNVLRSFPVVADGLSTSPLWALAYLVAVGLLLLGLALMLAGVLAIMDRQHGRPEVLQGGRRYRDD